MSVRRFDDTIEEGVAWNLSIPTNAAAMAFDMKARAQSHPSSPRVVSHKLYYRPIPHGVGPTSTWSTYSLSAQTMASGSTSYQNKPKQSINMTQLTAATGGRLTQFELTRIAVPAGVSNLIGDYDLAELIVEFS
jgi:hypothetical protein